MRCQGIVNALDDLEGIGILWYNFTKDRMLCPPPLGLAFVGINEEIGSRRTRRPSHHTLGHDRTMATTFGIP